MITKKIRFKTIEDVKKFCNVANRCAYNMDLVSGRYVVDAKSIMGILSLSLDKNINLEIQVDTITECEKFLQDISYCLCE